MFRKTKTLTWVSPLSFRLPPNVITPELVKHHYPIHAKDGKERQALIPSFFLHVLLISYPEKNSSSKDLFFHVSARIASSMTNNK